MPFLVGIAVITWGTAAALAALGYTAEKSTNLAVVGVVGLIVWTVAKK